MKHKITSQHTYTFAATGESVTAYVSDTEESYHFGLSFNHDGTNITWMGHYESILQIKSKVNPLVWYLYLTGYWGSENDAGKDIPIERVMMVSDCTVQPTK